MRLLREPAPAFDEPLEMLAACHERIEAQLDQEEVRRFAWLQRRHIDRETAALLPFAREVLDAAERAALGERMAARRSVTAL
jgi:hypothetical protein